MCEEYPSIPAVAVLKEAETDETLAEEKKNLGTAEFASTYFSCGPCFVDEEYSITRELVAVGETPKVRVKTSTDPFNSTNV